MSEHSLQLLQLIKERLNATARRRSLIDMTFGAVILLGVIAGAWLLATAIEAGFWLNTSSRQVALWSLVLLFAGIAAWFVLRPLLKMAGILAGPSQDVIARDIGRAYPQISDKLTNLLHLAEGRRSPAPDPFVDHAVRTLGQDVEQVEFEKMGNFEKAIRASRLAGIPLLGLIIFLIAAPGSFLGASARLLSPATEFQRPAPFQFTVSPGSIELIRGDSLTISVSLAGSELPQRIMLETRNEDEDKINTEYLVANEGGSFSRTFVNVRRSFSYRLLAGSVFTPWYDVEIVERPIIRSLQVSLRFPDYSRIPPQRLEANVGDVQAIPGTEVALDVNVGGRDVVEGFAVHSSGTVDTLSVSGNKALGAFTLREEGHYQIVLRDTRGVENGDPIKYALKLLPDAPPTVVLLEPAPLSDLNEALQSYLRSRITDDFGFARLRLYYRLAESRFGQTSQDFTSINLPLQNSRDLDQEINFNWIIREQTSLDLLPGDVVEYYLQVWDNDSFAGYKSAKSATHQLRLPSLAEQYKALDEQEDAVEDKMEELLDETREVKEQFEELRDELRNKQESDWEDQRQLEQLKEKQAELESKVEDLSSTFESMTQQMEENNLVSDETLEMYEEMQQVLEEINSPELMEALNDLQNSMQDLNLEQMQESLENFEFNEQQYQQRLERTLELFEQLRVQQDLEELSRRAEDLAKQQEKMQEETENLKDEAGAEEDENTGEENSGEENQGEQQEGEQTEGEQNQGEQQEGEQNEGEQNQGEQQEGEQTEGEQNQGEQQEGEQNQGEQNQGEQQEGEQSNEQLAKKQELSKEEMKQLEEQMREILEKMEGVKNAPMEQMQQLQENVEQQDIPQQMQDNAEQLRENQLDQAQQQQQQMQQQLQQMQQQMQQMQQGMQGAQMQVNLAGLRRALSDILTLSQQQEELREDIRGLAADSPVMRESAQVQVELSEGLTVVSDTLQRLSAKIPQMSREVQQHAGDALREMGSSVEAMTDRVPSRASGHQKESMMHLNELALLLSDLLNEMMNSQGSGGGGMSMQQMIQQLQQAAGQQQQLNQQVQQMLNEMQGNRLTQDMQERLRQMASQQEQIRSQIKSLSRNRELRGKVMGDLNRIAQQMEETINELQRNRPGRRTIERQQQILTRMLEATKSMQERGKEKKREGQIGEEQFRESPDEITPSEKADQLRRALIEALESGYSADYEELIKRYFELLQQRSN